MINHEAIRQICPDAVNIITSGDNTIRTGTDSNRVPIFSSCPIAYDVNGTQLFYDIPQAIIISKLMACKQQAKILLAQTDWAALPDIGLANADAFRDYRALIRALMITPVEEPTWPEKPTAGWS